MICTLALVIDMLSAAIARSKIIQAPAEVCTLPPAANQLPVRFLQLAGAAGHLGCAAVSQEFEDYP